MNSVRSNARWLGLAQAIKILLQLVSVTLLARLLTPKDYGLMAMTLAVANFAGIFRDSGISAAIIQVSDLSERHKSTAFWCSAVIGLLVGGGVCGVAQFASSYFNEPELSRILLFLAITFPLAGISAPNQAVMERAGMFKALAGIEVLAQLCGLIVAILMAASDFGVYALVAQNITAVVVVAVMQFRLSPLKVHFAIDRHAAAEIMSFGRGVLGFNVVNYFSRNSDTYIVGRVLGAGSLGVYNLAYRLMLFPLQSVTLVANRAMYPVLSRQKNSREELSSTYCNGVHFISLVTFPVMAGLWAVNDTFVSVVFGNRWVDLGAVIYWLAPVGMLQSITSTTGPVLMAVGMTSRLFRLGLLGALTQVSGIIVGAGFGLPQTALGYLIGNVAYSFFQFAAVRSASGVSLGQVIRALRAGSTCMVVMVLCILTADGLISGRLAPEKSLPIYVLVGALSYGATLIFAFGDSWRMLRSGLIR